MVEWLLGVFGMAPEPPTEDESGYVVIVDG